MPQSRQVGRQKRAKQRLRKLPSPSPSNGAPRYTVGLPVTIAKQVARYADTADTSMSKAIAALVSLGLESQQSRKREFFKQLKANLAGDSPDKQDRLVDEFRTLILGR